jgi:hypothetical protein
MDPDRPDPAHLLTEVVGRERAQAESTVAEAGFEPVVVPPGVTALTMDYRPRRIRLFVDDDGTVLRATAG